MRKLLRPANIICSTRHLPVQMHCLERARAPMRSSHTRHTARGDTIMGKSWLPSRDQELRAFCAAFLATMGDVALLNTHVTDYTDKLAVVDELSTKTTVSVVAKDLSWRTLMGTMLCTTRCWRRT